MSIEVGQKYIGQDGVVVEVIRHTKDAHHTDGIWTVIFSDTQWRHVLTERDFLEQYKPYEPVYEYQFLWKVKDGDCWDSVTTSYYKDIQECVNSESEEEKGRYEYQRLDFTERERK